MHANCILNFLKFFLSLFLQLTQTNPLFEHLELIKTTLLDL